MDKKDWFFKDDTSVCNFRSAGVLVRDSKILAQRDRNGAEYALLGGHVVVGETSQESLIREYKEETGADIVCHRLIWVEECFWTWNDRFTHTIVFYYLISLVHDSDIPDNGEVVFQKDNCNVLLTWIPLNSINHLTIFPPFLKEKIFCISENIEHFIRRE